MAKWDNNMHMINRTYSIPKDVDKALHLLVKKRGMSHFVTEAIRKELEVKENSLLEAYAMANEDTGQKEAAKDWECTISDGLNENNDW